MVDRAMEERMYGLTIGKLARKAGVGVETVRFYERRGLIEQPPKPAPNGVRTYPSAAVGRLRFIRQAQDLGFSLEEIRTLLALAGTAEADCAEVRRRAEEKMAEIDRKVERLLVIRRSLGHLVDRCPNEGTVVKCPIIGHFNDPEFGERADGRTEEV